MLLHVREIVNNLSFKGVTDGNPESDNTYNDTVEIGGSKMPKLPSVTKQEMLDAIREGVHDAMWRMITNATDAPCKDFYATIGDAVERAMIKVGDVKQDSRGD